MDRPDRFETVYLIAISVIATLLLALIGEMMLGPGWALGFPLCFGVEPSGTRRGTRGSSTISANPHDPGMRWSRASQRRQTGHKGVSVVVV